MLRAAFIFCLLATASGCMESQLRNKTVSLSTTSSDLFYIQVLDNVARTIDSPGESPYFDLPAAGTAQIQQSLSVTATPQWALLTAGPSAGAFLFNQFQGAATPQQIDQESWQVTPLADPDRLVLMHAAYLKATGHDSPEVQSVLNEYYAARDGWVDISIQQVHYSNTVWDLWHALINRQNEVLAEVPSWDLLSPTDRTTWENRLWQQTITLAPAPGPAPAVPAPVAPAPVPAPPAPQVPPITVAPRPLLPTDPQEERAQFLPLAFQWKLARDQAYQELKTRYNVLIPPQPPTPGPFGLGFAGAGSGTGSGGGGSSSPGGGGGGGVGGRPPLPIHVPYADFIRTGWYWTGKKSEIPKGACYVGHHCKTYVWVMPDQLQGLNDFTLAILDFNNIGNSGGSNIPQPPPATLGR
jgi:uncharacterized membrane protein YgcG